MKISRQTKSRHTDDWERKTSENQNRIQNLFACKPSTYIEPAPIESPNRCAKTWAASMGWPLGALSGRECHSLSIGCPTVHPCWREYSAQAGREWWECRLQWEKWPIDASASVRVGTRSSDESARCAIRFGANKTEKSTAEEWWRKSGSEAQIQRSKPKKWMTTKRRKRRRRMGWRVGIRPRARRSWRSDPARPTQSNSPSWSRVKRKTNQNNAWDQLDDGKSNAWKKQGRGNSSFENSASIKRLRQIWYSYQNRILLST